MTHETLPYFALFDLHYGWERRERKRVPLHDPKALDLALQIAADHSPAAFVFGGDCLDCGPLSHWNSAKPGKMEGERLVAHIEAFKRDVLDPVTATLAKGARKIWLRGNHEDWLEDFMDANPALEGLLDLPTLLGLPAAGWECYATGEVAKLGKVYFMHGDTIRGGLYVAKKAVEEYGRSVRFGHHHTHQVHTMTSAVDAKDFKDGVAVPCLCDRSPGYMERKPNRWVKGVLRGWSLPNGDFHDAVHVFANGQTVVDGKVYRA
jgi:hypothetical protein